MASSEQATRVTAQGGRGGRNAGAEGSSVIGDRGQAAASLGPDMIGHVNPHYLTEVRNPRIHMQRTTVLPSATKISSSEESW